MRLLEKWYDEDISSHNNGDERGSSDILYNITYTDDSYGEAMRVLPKIRNYTFLWLSRKCTYVPIIHLEVLVTYNVATNIIFLYARVYIGQVIF